MNEKSEEIREKIAEKKKAEKDADGLVTRNKRRGKEGNRANMSEAERKMAHQQEWALLHGGRVILGDPYALASVGGMLNIEDVDRIARQEARDKINELIQERKGALD